MARVPVVYHSGSGHKRIRVAAVRDGVASLDGVHTGLYAIEGGDIIEGPWSNPAIREALDAFDGILFGTPTYMGSVSGQMKALLDATRDCWCPRARADKVAAGARPG